MDRAGTSTQAGTRWLRSLERLRLRFRDPALESTYRDDRFRHNVANIRFAFLAGITIWIAWGLLLRPHILALADRRLDTIMRFGVFIPMLLVGFGLTFTPLFRRIWQGMSVVIATATILLWVYYVSNILTLPAEYGYVGVILITAFTYTLLRLRFLFVVLITVIGIAAYLPYAFTARYIVDVSRVLATLYLISFGVLGALAAYRLERFSRQVFLRERQLDRERERSDGLLLNILPRAIVEQLKTSSGGRHRRRGRIHRAGRTDVPREVRGRSGRALPAVRRCRRSARLGEDQDDRRRLHGRGRRAGADEGSCRGRRRDGARGPGRSGTGSVAVR
jgi:hypothetical protein